MEYFKFTDKVKYEGKDSKNPMAFRYYNKDRVVLGKKMSEHLPFAMAWWHTLGACGVDMFGAGTADKSFDCEKATMAHAKAKVDAGFEFMSNMGIDIKKSKVCGGGTKNKLWLKIIANVLGIELLIPENQEGASLGAAMLAAKGVMTCDEYCELENKVYRTAQTVSPEKELSKKYEEKYLSWRRLYPALKGIYKRLTEG